VSGLGDRLREARGRESRESAGARLKIHANTLKKYEDGERVPDADFVITACEVYGVRLPWLMLGQEPVRAPTLSEEPRPFARPEAVTSRPLEDGDDDLVAIPKLQLRAGAGGLQLVDDEPATSSISLRRSFLKALDIAPRYAVMMDAAGDSMSPTIADGDPMLLDTAKRDVRDKVYVIRRGGAVFVKRLQRRSDGSLLLLSDNPAHKPEPLPSDEADELEVLGLVRFVFKSI
jgi:phage repressor protein C with HTH and peptisase S24 domain